MLLATTVYNFNLAISPVVRERVRVQYLEKQDDCMKRENSGFNIQINLDLE